MDKNPINPAAERQAAIGHAEVETERLRAEDVSASSVEAQAQYKQTLLTIDRHVSDRKAAIRSEIETVRQAFTDLVPRWNVLASTPLGARMAFRLFGYSFPDTPKDRGAHIIAGTSLRGSAALVGPAEEAKFAELLSAEEAAAVADLEQRAEDSRIAAQPSGSGE